MRAHSEIRAEMSAECTTMTFSCALLIWDSYPNLPDVDAVALKKLNHASLVVNSLIHHNVFG